MSISIPWRIFRQREVEMVLRFHLRRILDFTAAVHLSLTFGLRSFSSQRPRYLSYTTVFGSQYFVQASSHGRWGNSTYLNVQNLEFRRLSTFYEIRHRSTRLVSHPRCSASLSSRSAEDCSPFARYRLATSNVPQNAALARAIRRLSRRFPRSIAGGRPRSW